MKNINEIDMFDFLRAIPDCKETGVSYYGKCPCGGRIRALRSPYNGHLRAQCDKCRRQVIE